VSEEIIYACVAVIVECNVATPNEDVVASIAITRLDPDRLGASSFEISQIYACQDVASPVTEEDSVR
jgi:hypothetical protein